MPFWINSPQFFSLAISKSNRLLAKTCCCKAICVLKAFLQPCCSCLSSGTETVALIPRDILVLFF